MTCDRYGRAGWYAFDFWDANAGHGRSSWRLLPEAQQLQVGLRIGEEGFTVRSFEPNQHLVLAYHYLQVEWVLKEGLWPKFGECSFVFVLQSTNDGGTRLLVRTRFTLGGLGVHLLWWPLFEVGDFLQQWRMLPGIKRRAEGLPAAGAQPPAKDEGPGRPKPMTVLNRSAATTGILLRHLGLAAGPSDDAFRAVQPRSLREEPAASLPP